jgi:hypothetical protein
VWEGIHWTNWTFETTFEEHHWHVCLYLHDKSTAVEHSINFGHHIQLQNTSILAKNTRCMDRITREAIDHPNNINREDGFYVCKL